MKKIGLLSDTHGVIIEQVYSAFANCDEIWHAGDIGNISAIDALAAFKPVRAVFGNIDDHIVRMSYPENQSFECEGLKVFMTHIGGYPGKYVPVVKQQLIKEKPGLFISGHSHILKIMYDPSLNCLHMNPGAAGIYGIHTVITMLRFKITLGKVEEPEIIEIERSKAKRT
jgi:putative phosphoesterase